MAIHPGYMGVANVSGGVGAFRFESASLAAKQDVNIPDMVMGHYDRAAYNFGKIEVGGAISGPVTENFAANAASSVFGWGAYRSNCGNIQVKDVELYYYCESPASNVQSRTFTNVYVNNLTFSCSAGDVAQFSMELTSMDLPAWSATNTPGNSTTEKLVTWDNVGVTITNGTGIVVPLDALLSSFEFAINNNTSPYYSLTASRGFLPTAIVPGLRTITGSLTAYDPQAFDGVFGYDAVESYGGTSWDAEASRQTITFAIGTATFSFKVQFHRVEPTLSVGPIMSTIAFTGTGVQSGIPTWGSESVGP